VSRRTQGEILRLVQNAAIYFTEKEWPELKDFDLLLDPCDIGGRRLN
jgi:hypothetical protein